MIFVWIVGGLLALFVLSVIGLIALIARIKSFGEPPGVE